MPFSTFYLSEPNVLTTGLSTSEIKEILPTDEGLLWVDVFDPVPEDEELLGEIFNFHHLHVREALDPVVHPPKIQEHDDHIYLIVHGIDYEAESSLVETAEVNIFIGKNFVVTVHTKQMFSIDEIKQRTAEDARPMRRGADFLVYSLLDTLVTNIGPTLERMRTVADEVEDAAISNPIQPTLQSILSLKRSAMRLNRAFSPQREVLLRLSRREFDVVGQEAELYYRDVYDHTSRIDESIRNIRERSDNAMALYLSAISVRQNETMKALAIVAAVFLPLSLVAGIYGMNFTYIPELGFKWGYVIVLSSMAVFAGAVAYWFWGRSWLNIRRLQSIPQSQFHVNKDRLLGYQASLVSTGTRTVSRTVGRTVGRGVSLAGRRPGDSKDK